MTISEKQIRGTLIVALLISLFLPFDKPDYGSFSNIEVIIYSPLFILVEICYDCSFGELLLALGETVPFSGGIIIVLSNIIILVEKFRKPRWLNLILVLIFFIWFIERSAGPIGHSERGYGFWVYGLFILLAGLAEILFLIRGRKKVSQPEEISS